MSDCSEKGTQISSPFYIMENPQHFNTLPTSCFFIYLSCQVPLAPANMRRRSSGRFINTKRHGPHTSRLFLSPSYHNNHENDLVANMDGILLAAAH